MMIDCPALHKRCESDGYPFGDKVPKTIRTNWTVTSDVIAGLPIYEDGVLMAMKGTTYPAWTNSYGAVSAVLPNGKKLGLKPDEFEVVEWHNTSFEGN